MFRRGRAFMLSSHICYEPTTRTSLYVCKVTEHGCLVFCNMSDQTTNILKCYAIDHVISIFFFYSRSGPPISY